MDEGANEGRPRVPLSTASSYVKRQLFLLQERFPAAIVPAAKQLIERSSGVAVVEIEVLVMQLVVPVTCANPKITGDLNIIETRM